MLSVLLGRVRGNDFSIHHRYLARMANLLTTTTTTTTSDIRGRVLAL